MRWNCERSKTYVRFSKSSSPPYGCIEANLNDDSCLRVFDSEVEVSTNGRSKIMNFERCFDESTNNHQVYMKAIQPLLHQCLRGVDGTIFTYGITSSVKKRTILGSFHDDPGLVDHTVEFLIRQSIAIKVSVMQLYNEQFRDLFEANSGNLTIRETPELGIHIPGITEKSVHSLEEFRWFLEDTNRTSMIWQMHMGILSSRMAYVYRIILENIPNTIRPELPTVINFVVLQGSERIQSGDSAQRLREASLIGRSLSAFFEVMSALTHSNNDSSDHRHFIPYRNSKLTRLLTNSLKDGAISGIYCVDLSSHFAEQVHTLRLASLMEPLVNRNWRRRKSFLMFLYHYGFRNLSNHETIEHLDPPRAEFLLSSESSSFVRYHPIFDNCDLCQFITAYL